MIDAMGAQKHNAMKAQKHNAMEAHKHYINSLDNLTKQFQNIITTTLFMTGVIVFTVLYKTFLLFHDVSVKNY